VIYWNKRGLYKQNFDGCKEYFKEEKAKRDKKDIIPQASKNSLNKK